MPPYSELIKTICAGENERTCYRCQKKVIVGEICSPAFGADFCLLPEFEGVGFFEDRGLQTICRECLKKDKEILMSEFASSLPCFQDIGVDCHNCSKSSETRLRCFNCQSKVYCSEECKIDDLKDHEMCCDLIRAEAEKGETGRRISKREVDRATEMRTKKRMELKAELWSEVD